MRQRESRREPLQNIQGNDRSENKRRGSFFGHSTDIINETRLTHKYHLFQGGNEYEY